jgi:DNA-binding NtrC family response regulator
MRRLYAAIERAAPLDLPVVIAGPTGSGKELVAERLHRRSGRSGHLVTVNVASLSDQLADAELFGAERGAYTGAVAARRGLVEEAAGGTLYLDEACGLPLALQAKLLRAIETGMVRRVGASQDRRIAFRLVVSIQRPATELLQSGEWRRDFYYRVAGVLLDVPALTLRASDLVELANHFLLNGGHPPLGPDAGAVLARYEWPGNVRELKRAVERAAFEAASDHITADAILSAAEPGQRGGPAGERRSIRRGDSRTLRDVEREHIELVLHEHGFDVASSARVLGLSLRALYRRLETLGLAPRRRHVTLSSNPE